MGIYNYTVKDRGENAVDLSNFKGKVILIVNTASNCGFTPQYEGLEALYQQYGPEQFVILGFPCNQFGNQESGTNDEIQTFCKLNYGVTFPIFSKIDVNGENADPLFQYLTKTTGGLFGGKIKWNFTKFLFDQDGNFVKRFSSITKPENISPEIEKLLSR